MAAQNEVGGPWYRGATRAQWQVFSSAYVDWMLDVMDLILFSVTITYIITEFDGSLTTAGLIASMTLVASAVGGIFFGFIADRYGRTRSMVASILVYSIGTALCGVSTSMTMLLVFRMVVGLGVGGEWSAGAALVSETWPARHRGKVMAWVQSAFASGYALAAVIAAVVIPIAGWRAVFFVGLLPALLAFWIRRHTPEPEIWREAPERLGVAESVRKLFAGNRRNLTVCFAFCAAASCGYWGLFTWIPSYLSTPVSEGGAGLSLVKSTTWIVAMQIGSFLGFVTFGYISDRIGRRNAFMMFFLASTACVPIFVTISSTPLMLIFGMVMAFFGTGFYSGFGPTFAELFPTDIRALATGFIYNTSRATSAIAPITVGALSAGYGSAVGLGSAAAFFLIAAVVVFLFLPETRGRELT